MKKENIFPEGDFVTTDWLAEHMDDVRILDAEWMPGQKYAGTKHFERLHIAGAAPFDQDKISGPELSFRIAQNVYNSHPSVKAFAKGVGALGVNNDDPVVVYDHHGLFSAPRAWWLFKHYGHENVRILEGGFEKWSWEARDFSVKRRMLAGDFRDTTPTPFSACSNLEWLARMDDPNFVSRNSVDLRVEDEFAAAALPRATNLPFQELVRSDKYFDFQTLKDVRALEKTFAAARVNPNNEHVAYCAHGLLAPIFALAIRKVTNDYNRPVPVYAGSMAEWSYRNS